MKIVAGEGGLDKIISWVHVVENPEHTVWLKGGELLLISGINIKGDLNALLNLIKDINSRNLSGIVINIGPYIESIPQEVIDLGNLLNFPVFELPFQVKFIDVSQSICRAIFMNKIQQESMDIFVEDLIYRDIVYTEDILSRAVIHGYNPKKSYCAFVINIENFQLYIKENKLTFDEERILQIKQRIRYTVVDTMNKWKKNIIYSAKGKSIIVLFPVNKKEKFTSIAKEISNNIELKMQGVIVKIGIGRVKRYLKDLKNSVHEAQRALKILKVCEKKDNISKYSDMGIYRLLFELDKYEEIKEIYEEILGELVKYDLKNSTNLVNTLEVYIKENGNLINTSKTLFIHRNTVKYRVKRIEDITGRNLRDINDLFYLNIGLKIRKFLKSI